MQKSSIICCGCSRSILIEGNITPNNNVKCPHCHAFNLHPNFSFPTKCKYCGTIIKNNMLNCSFCGKTINQVYPTRYVATKTNFQLDSKRRKRLVILIFMVFILSGYYINSCNKSDYEYLIGQPVPYEQSVYFGNDETLMGTNNQRWVVYFDKANFTMISNKETDIVIDIKKGRKPFDSPFSSY